MKKDTYCHKTLKGYRITARGMSDEILMSHYREYESLSVNQGKLPSYRCWRRAVIRECIKRGLLTHDPGGAPSCVALDCDM